MVAKSDPKQVPCGYTTQINALESSLLSGVVKVMLESLHDSTETDLDFSDFQIDAVSTTYSTTYACTLYLNILYDTLVVH